MNRRKTIIRIVALLMAILMGLSVFAIIFQILAADETALAASVSATGSDKSTDYVPYIAGAAVLVVALLFILPKLRKKK